MGREEEFADTWNMKGSGVCGEVFLSVSADSIGAGVMFHLLLGAFSSR